MALVHDVGTFDRFARWYDLAMPGAAADRLAVGLEAATRPLERGIDVAGGTGRASRSLPDVEWTVIDAAPGAVAVARERGLPAVVGDATRLPVAEGSVDAVLVVDALHHVRAPATVAREAAQVLRPGGVLVVREFDPETVLGRTIAIGESLFGFDSEFYRPADLAARFSTAGLEPAVPDRGPTGYTVVGRKPGDQ